VYDDSEKTKLIKILYNNWAETKFDRLAALEIKEEKFKRILVVGSEESKIIFYILNLDLDFIQSCKRKITTREQVKVWNL